MNSGASLVNVESVLARNDPDDDSLGFGPLLELPAALALSRWARGLMASPLPSMVNGDISPYALEQPQAR